MEVSLSLLKASALQASSRATLISDETPANSASQVGPKEGGGSSASSSAGGSSRGSIKPPLPTPLTTEHHYETIPPQITYTQLTSVHAYASDSFRRAPTAIASSSQTNLLSPSPYYGHATSDYTASPMENYSDQRLLASVNRDSTQEVLMAEIKRLRDRLVTLEAENASMSMKLSQQQWEVENRLAEIELQICGASGPGGASSVCTSSGSGDENERNRESII